MVIFRLKILMTGYAKNRLRKTDRPRRSPNTRGHRIIIN